MDLLALIWTASSYIWTSINKLDRTRPVDIVHFKLGKNWETPPRKTPSTGPVRPSSSNWTGPLDHRTGPVRSRWNWKNIERPPLERHPQLDWSIRPVQTGPDHWITGLVRSSKTILKIWVNPPRNTPSIKLVRPSSSNQTRPLDHWTGQRIEM